jgi:beta-glucosidase
VLLKNKDNILPIDPTVRRITVVGPNATNLDVLHGNYCGLNDSMSTLLEGIVGRVPEGINVEYRPGCALNQPTTNPLDRTVMKAAQSDVTIACMGLSPWMEGEEGDAILAVGGDRSDITLPANQVEFVKRLVGACPSVVLVLTGGSPIALGELADMVDAVVFVWYPGQEGGKAVADVLFGTVAPSGKLPLTFPESIAQLPPFEDYSMAGRTYRYSTVEPLYPFGFGLSYTRFAYGDLQFAHETICAGDALPFRVTLTNTGTVEANEVVQVYLSDLVSSVPGPLCNLIGFQRVRIAPGESKLLEFMVTPEMMMLVDDEGKHRLEPGQFRLTVGGCSPSARGAALGAPEPVSTVFTVTPRP